MTTAGVHHWLSSLNLHEQYEELLLAAGYDTLEKCAQLNDVVLEQIGVTPAGHRRRILLHLPRTDTDPSTPDYDSDDDREIYDIPPVLRKPGVVPKTESMYTNFAEMNEILKPVLPPKKRLSTDDEVGARLGIFSPPVKPPHIPYSIFDTSLSSADSFHSKPKLCVVYPEKRPPVPARRVSRDSKASSVTADNQLNNNVEGFEPGSVQKTPVSAPVAKPRTVLKHQDAVKEEDNKMGTVPVSSSEFLAPDVTAVGNVSAVHGVYSVPEDSEPKPFLQVEDSSADATSEEKRLNSELEKELQDIVSSAKQSAVRTFDFDTHITSSAVSSAVVQPSDSFIIVPSVLSNSGSCERTAVVEEILISTRHDHSSFEDRVEQTAAAETADTECVYVISDDETSDIDHLSQSSLYENQGIMAKGVEPRLLREKVEPSDELEYEIMDLIVPEGCNSHIRSSCESCHYPPPAFPPPPLPSDFAPHAYLSSGADNQIPVPPSRTRTSRTSGFANFSGERVQVTEPVKPQLPPRRRQSSANVVDDTLSPTVAGFSSALDDYLVEKIISPTDWLNHLNQPRGNFGQLDDISDSDFAPFVETQSPQSVSEFTKQSLAQSDPASRGSFLCEFLDLAEDQYALMTTKIKSFHNDAQTGVKPVNSEDVFKQDTCNKETG